MKKGKLFIFSAPSGAGKTTIVKHLLNKFNQELSFSISATTRPPRGQEVDGRDYYFISKEAFQEKIKNKEFVEYEEVYNGIYYGTLQSEIQRIWDDGKSVVFDIDVVGGRNLKGIFQNQALAIFVQPPSLEELERRLSTRGTDSIEKVKERIEKAEYELDQAKFFDTILLNDNLPEACQQAERLIEGFLKKE
ncbi:MAG TPA: guanylate kinase [Candidatus Sphingobacterium stercoripullorum]|nr:guanylate kinase [Candidatus Sphingobacterium stercoripullorum]